MKTIQFKNNEAPYIDAENLNQMQSNIEDAIEKSVVTANVAYVEVVASTLVKMTFESNINVGDAFTVDTNKITINKDMTLKISSNCTVQDQVTNPTNYYATLHIYKNGEKVNGIRNVASNTTTFMTLSLTLSPMLLEVKEGDYFELYVETSHNSTVMQSVYGRTNLTLEEV